MLEESAGNGAYRNVLGKARHTRTQTAYTSDDQVDLHARAGRIVQRVDDVRINKRIHLRDNAALLSGSRILRFLRDLAEKIVLHLRRSRDESSPLRRFRESGKRVKELGSVYAECLGRGKESDVGIDLRGDIVIVTGRQMQISSDTVFFVSYDEIRFLQQF